MASNISNERIENIYRAAIDAGAIGGKISGAGGRGFMVFFCAEGTKSKVGDTLSSFGGTVKDYNFVSKGLTTWKDDQ